MLILTRGPTESLKIGDDTTITVDEIRGEDFFITVTAPHKKLIRQKMHRGDSIDVGHGVVIFLRQHINHRGSIRFAIRAPREITVDRMEIWERKRAHARGNLARSA